MLILVLHCEWGWLVYDWTLEGDTYYATYTSIRNELT